MEEELTKKQTASGEPNKPVSVMDRLLRIGALFIILEPIWMLLPFAGFLYGSVMHIQWLSRNPYTSWLAHFVLPPHTLFPLGLVLIGIGLVVFLVGAGQIYSAKFFKKGLVTNGIYKKLRNPQYVALTFFGVGILLTWGRFITYIAFFVMMWLYYFLAKSEEKKCLAVFGEQYEAYRQTTFFLFPGESVLLAAVRKAKAIGLPAWANAAVSFVLVMGMAVGSGFLIQNIKHRLRPSLPLIEGNIRLPDGNAQPVRLMMVKGPALQAAPFENAHHLAMEKAFEMLVASGKIKAALTRLPLEANHALLAFLTPGSNWHTGAHHNARAARINAFMVVVDTGAAEGTIDREAMAATLPILKSIKVQDLSYGRLVDGIDPAQGDVRLSGPPFGRADAAFQRRIRSRMVFLASGL